MSILIENYNPEVAYAGGIVPKKPIKQYGNGTGTVSSGQYDSVSVMTINTTNNTGFGTGANLNEVARTAAM